MSGPYLPGYDAWKLATPPEYDAPDLCEGCEKRPAIAGEDLCEECRDNAAEAANERAQEEPCFRGPESEAAQRDEADSIRRNLK